MSKLLTVVPSAAAVAGNMPIFTDSHRVGTTNLAIPVTGSLTGFAAPPAPALKYSVIGKHVAVQIPAASGTSNATTMTLTGAPASVKPVTAQTVVCRVTDNGTTAFGLATIGTDGVITFGTGAAGGVFTGTGTKGVPVQTLTYSLD